MTKTYHLTLTKLEHVYRHLHVGKPTAVVCASQIQDMAKWQDRPKRISIIVSDRKLPGFREVKIVDCCAYGNGIYSKGRASYLASDVRKILAEDGFGPRFWIRIRAAA